MDHLNAVASAISWTPDYPIPDVEFADLSRVFGHPSLSALAGIVTRALCIERGQVVLGVPTRGLLWATVVANAAQDVQAIYLTKAGVGTPAPGLVPLVSSGTVYSGDKRTAFLVAPADVDRMKAADIVWVLDDVVESGSTLAAIRQALLELGCQDVRLLPFLTFPSKVVDPKLELYSVLERRAPLGGGGATGAGAWTIPGRRVFGSSPSLLFTLRGPVTSGWLQHRVYGPPSMNELLIEYCQTHVGFAIGDIRWDHFDGGLPNVSFEMPPDYGDATPGNVVFIYDANRMDTTQDGVVHALARNCRGHMTVIIPFLGQGTLERTDREGTLATAQTTLFSLCAAMPLTGKGPVVVEVYDIHATAARFYTTDRVQYVSRQVLQQLVPPGVDIIAFPDGGALSRFRHLFPGKTLLVFSKVRDGNQRKICLSEKIGPAELVGPDGKGASVFIVDDLVRSGATLLETAKILRSMGAGYIGAAIVHIDFDPGRTLPFVKNGLINEIATTNSNPGKARALFLAAVSAGFKVCLSSIFDAGSRFRYRYSAGEAVPPCILASSSETKLEAVRRYAKSCYGARFPASLYGIYTGAVPSHVSEQPIGETEILAGAQNRYYLCRHLYGLGSQTVISFESGLKAPRFQDVAVGIMDGPDSRNKKWVDGPFVPADMVHSLETLAGKTVGEFLQRAHNLPSKDAWILHFSDTHTDRAAQLAKTLEQ